MQNIKKINIKNRTYYFLNDMINVRDFHSKNHTETLAFTALDTLR